MDGSSFKVMPMGPSLPLGAILPLGVASVGNGLEG